MYDKLWVQWGKTTSYHCTPYFISNSWNTRKWTHAVSSVLIFRKTPMGPLYRFVLELAINDLYGITLATPFVIARYVSNFYFTFSHSFCDCMAFIQTFAILSSACIVSSMSLDGFIAIVFPLKYSVSVKERRGHVVDVWWCPVTPSFDRSKFGGKTQSQF